MHKRIAGVHCHCFGQLRVSNYRGNGPEIRRADRYSLVHAKHVSGIALRASHSSDQQAPAGKRCHTSLPVSLWFAGDRCNAAVLAEQPRIPCPVRLRSAAGTSIFGVLLLASIPQIPNTRKSAMVCESASCAPIHKYWTPNDRYSPTIWVRRIEKSTSFFICLFWSSVTWEIYYWSCATLRYLEVTYT